MKNGSSGDLFSRLKFDYYSGFANSYWNDDENYVHTSVRKHYEYVYCGDDLNSLPCKTKYPNCISLKLTDSPDILAATQFDSMNKLQFLEIT